MPNNCYNTDEISEWLLKKREKEWEIKEMVEDENFLGVCATSNARIQLIDELLDELENM